MPRVRRREGPTPAATLLGLIWLASPALPVGGFSYSEGLEAAVDADLVRDEASAQAWLLDQLALGLQRSELPLLAAALKAWRRGNLERIRELNDWLLATRETAESRLQTEQMGRSLAAWLMQQHARGEDDKRRCAALVALAPAPTYPVAWALAASRTAASPRDAALAYAFAWGENMVQAALKSVPLGQSAGQRILAALTEALPTAVDAALALADSERIASLPGLAILGARHEIQYSRLFRS